MSRILTPENLKDCFPLAWSHYVNLIRRCDTQEKKKRVVFWYDGDKEFEETLPSIQLDNVKVVNLTDTSSLELKSDYTSCLHISLIVTLYV